MSSASASESLQVKRCVDEFEQTVMIASENGLFTRQSSVKYEDLEALVVSALRNLTGPSPDVIKARSEYAKAYDAFNTAVDRAGFAWRIQYAYAIPCFLYLVAVLAVVLYAWFAFAGKLPGQNLALVPTWAFLWGTLGSVLQGFWWLWKQVNVRHFRKHWLVWFLAVPFIGALVGAIMYLAFLAGFIAATKSTIQDNTVPMLLAALAGFSWEWAVRVLQNLTKLFAVGGQS